MNKQINRLVPELRFPEFLSNSGWEGVYGNKAFEQINNKNHNSDFPILAITQEYGAIPREMIDYNVSVTEKSVQSYKVVDVGNFIISLRSFQGGIEYSEYKGLCSPAYVILRNKKGINKRFFKQYFKTKSFIRDLTKNLEGLRDGKMISYKQFSEILLPKPSPEEQQKIADCLASIDELITLHTQKLNALKDHKKGLMQQLFPAEGETKPKLRFPEFSGNAEWNELPLSQFIKSLDAGVSVNSTDRPANLNEKGILKTSSVANGYFEPLDNKAVVEPIEQLRLKQSVKKDTIIISRMNTPSLVGANGYVEADIDNIFLPDRLWAAKPQPGTYMRFISCILSSSKGRATLSELATGTSDSMKNITKTDVLKIRIRVPTLEEQKRVADFISSIDKTISFQAAKIDELKNHKNGLIQKLFPIMDGVVS
ncbi:restriction endonuclease subunit S [Providencia sp. PROV117]|uniref:restriction endonuclease subunit S n=1 Tax=Providencia sp. PROV117 TaxID=2949828 RepID=UPI00234AF714|nr:restriction endonuclease subunit S [Providencia sp. PROV117]